jgi:signal transduction histidine kinase
MKYDKHNKQLDKLKLKTNELEKSLSASETEKLRLRKIIDGLLHETRRINSEISTFCEELNRSVNESDSFKTSDLADSISYASGLISSRLVFTDFELNPKSLGRQPKIRMSIYKKFDKAKRLLTKSARAKHCSLALKGNSFMEIEAIPALELAPFIIIDNAIKYSPSKQSIDIEFEDPLSKNCHTRVTVTSIGPLVTVEELPKIIERGQRGSYAKKLWVGGDGLGLFLVNTLAKTSNAKLSVISSPEVLFSVGGVPHSKFKATLDFYRSGS